MFWVIYLAYVVELRKSCARKRLYAANQLAMQLPGTHHTHADAQVWVAC